MGLSVKDMVALASAMWQVLDDMGKDGHSVCPYTKAVARVAYEPFLQADFAAEPTLGADYAPDMTLEDAKALIEEVHRDTRRPRSDRHALDAE